MNSIAVFCGSALGVDPDFAGQAQHAGEMIAKGGKILVYGGGRSGLMGIVADSALAAGGKVIGVMPQGLADNELAHPALTELHIVSDMHERKTKMSELADGFVALPGGAGTLEEIFEQWTWAQLGIHLKPCAFLNVNGFYDDLIRFLQQNARKGFTKTRFTDALICAERIEDVLQQFDDYVAPEPKWGTQDHKKLVTLDR